MPDARRSLTQVTRAGLKEAVHRSRSFSRRGLQERAFTFAFQRLVYPQIWEDPVVDLEALALRPGERVIAIASGGCNILSYLTADPAEVIAVDLNGAHIALNELKLCALQRLPDYATFFRFFGRAEARENVAVFDGFLSERLSPSTRAYWNKRGVAGRRIEAFARNFYRHGLLGRFIGASHLIARLYGADFEALLRAGSLDQQRKVYEREIAPLFEKRFVRWLSRRPAALFALGIPPAQYGALAGDHSEGIVTVLRQRVQRLACDFPIQDNYFAWQAFGRRYSGGEAASVPPYLQRENFEALRARADRVSLRHGSFTEQLAKEPASALDAYVLLDAQDWMTDATLTALWTQILRTARPGARVIFRTAANERLLPGRIPGEILEAFDYEAEGSARFSARDRSSIYGAFHLYRRRP